MGNLRLIMLMIKMISELSASLAGRCTLTLHKTHQSASLAVVYSLGLLLTGVP